MTWKVRLSASDQTLELLADSFDDDPQIVQDDEKYYLKSSKFEDCDKSEEVREKAVELVKMISGLFSIEASQLSDLEVSHVYEERDDGPDRVNLSVTETVAVSDSVSISISEGEEEREVYSTGDRTAELTELALVDEAVAEVVLLLNKGDDWVNLYRIFEHIQADAEGIVDKGWLSESEKNLFKRTANSKEVLGYEARHGAQKVPAPSDPMTHKEAKQMIHGLVESWIDTKR